MFAQNLPVRSLFIRNQARRDKPLPCVDQCVIVLQWLAGLISLQVDIARHLCSSQIKKETDSDSASSGAVGSMSGVFPTSKPTASVTPVVKQESVSCSGSASTATVTLSQSAQSSKSSFVTQDRTCDSNAPTLDSRLASSDSGVVAGPTPSELKKPSGSVSLLNTASCMSTMNGEIEASTISGNTLKLHHFPNKGVPMISTGLPSGALRLSRSTSIVANAQISHLAANSRSNITSKTQTLAHGSYSGKLSTAGVANNVIPMSSSVVHHALSSGQVFKTTSRLPGCVTVISGAPTVGSISSGAFKGGRVITTVPQCTGMYILILTLVGGYAKLKKFKKSKQIRDHPTHSAIQTFLETHH